MTKTRLTAVLNWGIAIVVLLILLVILIFNPDRWRDFLFDITFSVFIQAIIALLFLAIVNQILRAQISHGVGKLNFWQIRTLLFSLGAILALPFLALILHRNIDIYDLTQTVGLIACFAFLGQSISHFFIALIRNTTQSFAQVGLPISSKTKPLTDDQFDNEEKELFDNLLGKTLGNRKSALGLMTLEQNLRPGLSRREYIQRAIDTYIRDHSR